jgi:hypothetical protein
VNMTDEEIKEGIRELVAEATGDPFVADVAARNHEGTMQLTVRFTREPERFSFLPLMASLAPISENEYSNRFGEKSWTIGGQFGGRKVSVCFRVEFLRERE